MSRGQRGRDAIDDEDEVLGLEVEEAVDAEPELEEAEDAGLEADDAEDASWDELLERRRAAGDEDSDDVIDLMSAPDAPEPVAEARPVRATPLREGQEFVCKSCHLVKPRTQLADASRGLCRDCM